MEQASNKFPDIQILRALACLAVLFSHFDFLDNILPDLFYGCQRQGVYLFFAISGFVIAKSLDNLGLFHTPSFSLFKVYLKRRLFRIFPVALLNIFLMAIASFAFKDVLTPMLSPQEFLDLLRGFFTLSVDLLRWGARVYGNEAFFDYGYWSLSGEEKAYLLFAIVCMFSRTPKQMLKFFIIWTALFYGIHIWCGFFIEPQDGMLELYYHSPFITSSQFFGGSAVYLLFKKLKPEAILSKISATLFIIPLLIFTFAAFSIYDNNVQAYLASLIFSPFIVYLAATRNGIFIKNFVQNFFVKFGNRSYIVYLVHAPVAHYVRGIQNLHFLSDASWVILSPVLTIGLLIIITEIIHKKFEQPLIRFGRKTQELGLPAIAR